MNKLKALILLAVLFAPVTLPLFSCDRKTDVKQEVTDDGKGNRSETTIRKFH